MQKKRKLEDNPQEGRHVEIEDIEGRDKKKIITNKNIADNYDFSPNTINNNHLVTKNRLATIHESNFSLVEDEDEDESFLSDESEEDGHGIPCFNCNFKVKESDKFCGGCGNNLKMASVDTSISFFKDVVTNISPIILPSAEQKKGLRGLLCCQCKTHFLKIWSLSTCLHCCPLRFGEQC